MNNRISETRTYIYRSDLYIVYQDFIEKKKSLKVCYNGKVQIKKLNFIRVTYK